MTKITTARDLAQRLLSTFDPDKPIVIDIGLDHVYGVNLVTEETNEIFIFLGVLRPTADPQ